MHKHHLWTSVALIAVAGACGDNGQGPTGPTALLQDTWVATAWEYTNQADPSQQVSLTSQGVAVTLTIGTNDYSIVFSAPGQSSQTISGTYTVNGATFVITEAGATEQESISFSFSNNNNTLTMSDPNSNWDFDDDGIDDPATLSMVFTRK